MGPKKENDFPKHMSPDFDRGGYVVRNPITGKKKRFAAEKEKEAREAAKIIGEWVDRERRARELDAGKPLIAGLVDRWITDRLPFMPWDAGTTKSIGYKLARIRRELGKRVVSRTDCLFLEDWLGFCKTADQFNDWRYVLTLLWRFAVAKKMAETNEAEKLEVRSTSKKIASNQKVRQQLDISGFRGIHDKAPAWLQIAMEQSLVTLQARTEVCNMKHTDYRNGYLFVIRDKVSGDSDMAFIKIAITEELEDIRRRSLTLDGTVSPYLVHRAPPRERREWIEGKPHWTYVNPEYLSKAFAKARDASGLYVDLKGPQRPTFHEIRGLGARVYRAAGMSESDIQALMTHSNERTTRIYLDRGAAALSDDDYHTVRAPLSVREMLGVVGRSNVLPLGYPKVENSEAEKGS